MSDEGARKASTERDKALDDAKVAQDAAQAARAARDATQATYHGLTKRTATLDAELAGLRAERRASRRGIVCYDGREVATASLSETVEERLDSPRRSSKARETQREERQRATHYAQELSNQQLTHRKFAADCAVALRAAEVDRGLWRLKRAEKAPPRAAVDRRAAAHGRARKTARVALIETDAVVVQVRGFGRAARDALGARARRSRATTGCFPSLMRGARRRATVVGFPARASGRPLPCPGLITRFAERRGRRARCSRVFITAYQWLRPVRVDSLTGLCDLGQLWRPPGVRVLVQQQRAPR